MTHYCSIRPSHMPCELAHLRASTVWLDKSHKVTVCPAVARNALLFGEYVGDGLHLCCLRLWVEYQLRVPVACAF